MPGGIKQYMTSEDNKFDLRDYRIIDKQEAGLPDDKFRITDQDIVKPLEEDKGMAGK